MAVIDRIEGQLAVVELDKDTFVDVPLSQIDGQAREGATLQRTPMGFKVDEDATAARHAAIQQKANRLFRRRS